ncbi:MAG: type II toxin-antitoxin system VapC family toxin [Thermodesulfobacteriota bacterium]|nr:type II toxin-antitoxin system VapC family toxin [Thermodesulfobacteriota bacterium]
MIILDTHIWIWWVNGDDSLGTGRKELIETTETVAVSAISCFEVSWLEHHNRIELPYDRRTWFDKALQGSNIMLMPITPEIASIAVDLPEHHSDPQDRIIIATALAHDGLLMSLDSKFPYYVELSGRLV